MAFNEDPIFYLLAFLIIVIDLIGFYLRAWDQKTAQSVFLAVVTLVLGWMRGKQVTEQKFKFKRRGGI